MKNKGNINVTYHKTGLQIHKKKKHGSRSCELCDNIFDKARDLKMHMYTHSNTETVALDKRSVNATMKIVWHSIQENVDKKILNLVM